MTTTVTKFKSLKNSLIATKRGRGLGKERGWFRGGGEEGISFDD